MYSTQRGVCLRKYVYNINPYVHVYTHNIVHCFSDNLPMYIAKSWPLEATMFDGELIAGPMPTLFCEDGEAAEEAILADPLKCHWDLQKIMKAFFMPESISMEQAVDLIKKPREGAAIFCFKRPRLTAPMLQQAAGPAAPVTPKRGRPRTLSMASVQETASPVRRSAREPSPTQPAKKAKISSEIPTGISYQHINRVKTTVYHRVITI